MGEKGDMSKPRNASPRASWKAGFQRDALDSLSMMKIWITEDAWNRWTAQFKESLRRAGLNPATHDPSPARVIPLSRGRVGLIYEYRKGKGVSRVKAILESGDVTTDPGEAP